MKQVFHKKAIKPLADLFKQGLSPDKLALCIVLGAAISVFPVVGTTSLLCALAAMKLGLNLPGIQAVNWLFAGAQIALLYPFAKIGGFIVGTETPGFAAGERASIFSTSPLTLVGTFWEALLCALVGWALTCVPIALVAYLLLSLFLGRKPLGRSRPSAERNVLG